MTATLVYINPVDPFNLYIKLSIMGGLIVASPYVLLATLAFHFARPLSQRKEVRLAFRSLTSGFFICGGYFAYQPGVPGSAASSW